MKKYFLLGLMIAIAPNICFGAGARYTQLVREKQRKMEELEKCMGATNGLKIAGLSTIGLTAVGVAGNVVQAKKLDEYESGIESKQKELEKVNKDIAEKEAEIKKAKEAEEAAAAQKKAEEEARALYQTNCLKTGGSINENGTCICPDNSSLNEGGFCNKQMEIVSVNPNIAGQELKGVDANNLYTWNSGSTNGGQDSASPSKQNENLSTDKTETGTASDGDDDENKHVKNNSQSSSANDKVNQSPKKTSSNNTASKATSGDASSKIYQSKINLAHNATEVSSRSYTGVCERGTLSNNFVRQRYACTTESTGNWITKFDSYTAKGGSYCAGNKMDTVYTAGTPSGSGSNCWCKVTNSAGNNSWVYTSFVPNCSADCAYHCAYQLGTYEKFRREALLY